jgi:alpha-glucosidase (family GH31 glycosyl hydrolase)
VTLSRAAYPGSSALSAALWSGDVETNFATLAAQVRVAQQASMSGVALWASDTGGTFIASDAAPARCARNCDPYDPYTQPYARPRP